VRDGNRLIDNYDTYLLQGGGVTKEGGHLVYRVTEENVTRGNILEASAATDFLVRKATASSVKAIGTAYKAASAGAIVPVVVAGRGPVQLRAGQSPARGDMLFVSATAGEADITAVPGSAAQSNSAVGLCWQTAGAAGSIVDAVIMPKGGWGAAAGGDILHSESIFPYDTGNKSNAAPTNNTGHSYAYSVVNFSANGSIACFHPIMHSGYGGANIRLLVAFLTDAAAGSFPATFKLQLSKHRGSDGSAFPSTSFGNEITKTVSADNLISLFPEWDVSPPASLAAGELLQLAVKRTDSVANVELKIISFRLRYTIA